MKDRYLGTVIYMLFVPFLLLVLTGICDVLLFPKNTNSFFNVIFFIILCFLAMFLYGYFSTRKISDPPENLADIYLPAFIPLSCYMLWVSLFNYYKGSVFSLRSLEFLGIIFDFYGWMAYESLPEILKIDSGHYELLYNLLHHILLILGFTAGERFSAFRTGMKRDRKMHSIQRKKVILLFSFLVIFYAMSEFVLFRHNRNLVPSADASYGFAYEGGYSSINLKPYYVDNEENILAKLDGPSDFTISNPADMPFLDGAEAAYPVYSAFANACYEDIAKIQDMAKNTNGKNATTIMPVQFSNTIRAYKKLLNGEIDIFLGAKPSKEQLQMAEDAGKDLVLTPIGKEAFVFFVNEENPVDSLSSEQIRSIYSGEINKWSQVGGKNERILAFQRPENSGSQTMMEYFMGDIPLKEPLETEYEASMGGLVRTIAAYDNGTSSLGYSFRYYASIMMNDAANVSASASESDTEGTGGIKFLAVDGVYPDTETIRSEEYPLTTQLYAITVIDPQTGTYSKDTIEPFLEWMTGPQGQQLVADTGYVSLE